MEYAKLCDSEYRFMCVIWEAEPVSSGELVTYVRKSWAGRINDLHRAQKAVREGVSGK